MNAGINLQCIAMHSLIPALEHWIAGRSPAKKGCGGRILVLRTREQRRWLSVGREPSSESEFVAGVCSFAASGEAIDSTELYSLARRSSLFRAFPFGACFV